MEELVTTFLLVVTAALAVAVLVRRHFSVEAQGYIWLGFAGHMAATVAQVVITRDYYGGGDMFLYYNEGMMLAELMRTDFGRFFPLVLELIAGNEPYLPIDIIGAGSSTGSMSGVCGVLLLLTFDSIYGVCFLFSMVAFSGQLAMVLAVREAFPPEYQRRLLLAALFVPSVVYWSSAVLKEPLALGGVGWAVLGFRLFVFRGRYVKGALFTLAGAGIIAVSKPYVLFPLAIACGAWLYWHRTMDGKLWKRVAYLVVSGLLTVTALHFLGEAYPKYKVSNLTNETANLQKQYYRKADSGSTISYGAASSDAQLYYAPLALFTALFRPFAFEAHNATSLVNAIETTIIAMLLMVILARSRHRIPHIFRSPTTVFMLVFVLVLGTAVGLGSPNLGSLSRYRIPMMPFYAMLIAVLLPFPRRRRKDDE